MWVTGFTCLRCGQGWVYLCAVRDAHSRRVLGWAMSSRGTPARSSLVMPSSCMQRGLVCANMRTGTSLPGERRG